MSVSVLLTFRTDQTEKSDYRSKEAFCVCLFALTLGERFLDTYITPPLFLLFLVLRWRTKQNLDYCFLMMYAQSKGTYYVQVRNANCSRCDLV